MGALFVGLVWGAVNGFFPLALFGVDLRGGGTLFLRPHPLSVLLLEVVNHFSTGSFPRPFRVALTSGEPLLYPLRSPRPLSALLLEVVNHFSTGRLSRPT